MIIIIFGGKVVMKKVLGVLLTVVIGISLLSCSGNNQDDAFNMLNLFHDDLVAVSMDDQWGYINSSGETVIDFKYDGAGAFYNGYAVVMEDDLYDLIDTEGNSVLENQYQELMVDVNTGLLIYGVDNRHGLMTTSDENILDPTYDSIWGFENGLAVVRLNGKFGFINTKGEVIVDIIYDDAMPFYDELACVELNDKVGFINKEGDVVIDFIYDQGDAFINGFVVVSKEDQDYLINLEGDIILNKSFIRSSMMSLYSAKNEEDELFYIYKSDGTKLTDVGYKAVAFNYFWLPYLDSSLESEYLLSVITEDDEEMIVWFNKDGTVFRTESIQDSQIFNRTFTYEEDALIVKDGEYIDFVTRDKTYRLEAMDVEGFFGGKYFIVRRYNDSVSGEINYGILNEDGDIEVEFLYDELVMLEDNHLVFRIDGLFGIMDDDFNIIVDAAYDNINLYVNPNM